MNPMDTAFSLWRALLCAAGGYLIGNIQTAIIVSRAYYHDDVRRHGSRNAGSTNMVRVYGWAPGAITFAGDFCKAVGAYFLGTLLMGVYGGYLAGLCTVLGHCWPVFAGFRGGKGVASSCGLAFCVFPLGAAIALSVGVVIALLTKKISLMSLSASLLLAVLGAVLRPEQPLLVLLLFLMLAVIYVRHIENIRRLVHGEETRLRGPEADGDAGESEGEGEGDTGNPEPTKKT